MNKIDNYSFIKYIDMKQKKYEKYKDLIELKIKQTGGHTIEIFGLQNELLKVKARLEHIIKNRKNVNLDPYDKLKPFIDSINSKIYNIEKEINGISNINNLESEKIINKIREIDVLIGTSAADYKTVQTDRKLQFVTEKLDPNAVTKVFDSYIDDTTKLVNDLKVKMGGGKNLVNNQEIYENILAIDEKMKAYDEKMKPIIGLDVIEDGVTIHTPGIVEEINEYIDQMESLYRGNKEQNKEEGKLVLIDKEVSNYTKIGGFLIEPSDSQKDKIIVQPEQMKDNAEFSFYEDLVKNVENDGKTEDIKTKDLISPGFIKTETEADLTGGADNQNYNIKPESFTVNIKKKEVDKTMKNLHDLWLNKLEKIRKENDEILKYQIIKNELERKLNIFEKVYLSSGIISTFLNENLIIRLKSLNTDIISVKDNLENCKKLILEFNETKKINASIESKCIDRNISEKDLLDEINKHLEIQRTIMTNKLDTINSGLKDEKFITALMTKEQEKENPESNKMRDDFIKLVYEATPNAKDTREQKIRKDFNEMLSTRIYTSEHLSINYLDAFIKFSDSPKGNTERYDYKPIIDYIKKRLNLAEFVTKLKKLDLSSKMKTSRDEAISNIKKAKTILESDLSILNTFLNQNNNVLVQKGGENMHMNDFILKLSEFEAKIREMKNKRNEVKKLIKKYNVRYTQFFNFQKYIVNYVSLVLAQEEYEYWNLISKGSISFYENVLRRLEDIVDKFENPTLYKENNYKTAENIWFYSKHFFIIKILRKFFSELYILWDSEDVKYKNDSSYNINIGDPKLQDSISEVRGKVEKNEKGYENLDQKKIELKALRLYKRKISNLNPWNLKYKLSTLADVQSSSPNKNYFFLFNLFIRILDVYQMKLPPVANYMRINFNNDVASGNTTFVKNTKNFLKDDTLLKCFQVDLVNRQKTDPSAEIDPDATMKATAVQKIKFEEIFDPDNFQENDALAMYMGLGNMLSQGKSVMLLTYGYSGVGKTFTLFGSKGVEGMLQSTLNGLSGSPKIEMKAFELYGLGVPYKFYWESNKFTHNIYKYELTDAEDTKINPNPQKFIDDHISYENKIKSEKGTFNDLLNPDNHYELITTKHIKSFEEIVTNIDEIRKKTGRIKATVNNPESSRSIMIYDFKITISPEKISRLVVMDLPGKENLYETYCKQTSINNSFEPRSHFYKHRPRPEKDIIQNTVSAPPPPIRSTSPVQEPLRTPTASVISDGSRQGSIISDETTRKGIRNRIIGNLGGPSKLNELHPSGKYTSEDVKALKTFDASYPYETLQRGGGGQYDINMIKAMMYINPLWLGVIPETAEHFDEISASANINDHLTTKPEPIPVPTLTSYGVTQDLIKNNNISEYEAIRKGIINIEQIVYTANENVSHHSVYKVGPKSALYGLTSRALAYITNMINKEGGLEDLGAKINNMLVNEEYRKKRYGYAGLEGVYINENILGLLEVLGDKIQDIRDTSKEKVSVVCSQNEIYKSILKETITGKYPIGWKDLINNGTVKEGRFIDKPSILVQENEFISQIMTLRDIIKSKLGGFSSDNPYFNPTGTDLYNNYFRTSDNLTLKINNQEKGLSANLEDINNNWINNYDYNKIFNIKNPPIKSILAPYLADETFKNFYMFFVTSNNVKETADPSKPIDTCAKQIQLVYDTRHFMNVISNTPSTLKCNK